MRPGPAAIATGTVWHRRSTPTVHEFTEPVSMVWIDPAEADELCRRHPLWSTGGRPVVTLRSRDYGLGASGRHLRPAGGAPSWGALAAAVRSEAEAVLGDRPTGPIRMLGQPRRWGWLFNPLTVYVVWHDGRPAVVVAEVTNTPWKERHHYVLALATGDECWSSSFAKHLHVSPFLDESQRYHLRISEPEAPGSDRSRRLRIDLDVHPDEHGSPILETSLLVDLEPATTRSMTRFLTRHPFATHRVSAAIHLHAARLASKRVPFVAHPRRRRNTHEPPVTVPTPPPTDSTASPNGVPHP